MTSLHTRVVRNARAKGVVVYTQKDWGSNYLWRYAWRVKNKPHAIAPDNPVDTLYAHITVTYDTGRTHRSFKRDMRTLERIGNDRFKSGVSYNVGWDMQTGDIGIGQYWGAKGTHTINYKGVNAPDGEPLSRDQNAVAFAFAGIGMPGAVPTPEAIEALGLFFRAVVEESGLTTTFDFLPHSYVAYKDCPTDAIRDIMPELKKIILKPSVLEGRPNLQHAQEDLKKVRRHTEKGTELHTRVNRFLRWLKNN